MRADKTTASNTSLSSESESLDNKPTSRPDLLLSVDKMSTVSVPRNSSGEAQDNDGFGTGHGDPNNSPAR